MKRSRLSHAKAYRGVAGAFEHYGVDYIIMAKTADDVSRIYARMNPDGNPNPAKYKNVVLTAASYLEDKK